MGLPRMSSPRGSTRRRVALWSALAMGWILTSTGCQVEYAGMTLPSGRYMHDDVQYFPSGPDFPWANTQAATQRARMRAMGIEPTPPVGTAPAPPGYAEPVQQPGFGGGRGQNINVQPMPAPAGQPQPNQPPPPNQAPQPPAPQPPQGGVPAPANAPDANAPQN
jgi:hypothetical protein